MPRPLHGLRRRIDQSPALSAVTGGAAAVWTGLCNRTTRWQRAGDAEIAAALSDGPVIVVLWHEMVMMGPAHWRPDWGPLATLHDSSPAGRSGSVLSRRLGGTPFILSARQSNLGATRDVLGLIRAGASLAVTGDGPRGPRRTVQDGPLDWARAAGVPVFAYAWAIAGMPRAASWDRMLLARPFARGAVVFSRWPSKVPRRLDDAAREALRADLAAHLTATATTAEAMVATAPQQK